MESIERLAEKATWESLSQEEIDYITQTFYSSKQRNDDDLANCIYILGRIAAIQHKKAIEKYLHYPQHPDVSATALRVLCLYWKYTEEYLDEVVAFIKGVPWDDCDDVRLWAFSALGKYLQKNQNPKLLKLLLDFVEDPTKIEGFYSDRLYALPLLQAFAFVALGSALGKPDEEIPYFEDVENVIEEGRVQELIFLDEARAYLKKNNF